SIAGYGVWLMNSMTASRTVHQHPLAVEADIVVGPHVDVPAGGGEGLDAGSRVQIAIGLDRQVAAGANRDPVSPVQHDSASRPGKLAVGLDRQSGPAEVEHRAGRREDDGQ